MRYILPAILLVTGVLLLGVAVVAYMQLKAMAALPNVPNMEDYPAVTLIASDLWEAAANPNNGAPPKPQELASQTMRRIGQIGFAGAVLAVLGLLLGAISPRRAKSIGV